MHWRFNREVIIKTIVLLRENVWSILGFGVIAALLVYLAITGGQNYSEDIEGAQGEIETFEVKFNTPREYEVLLMMIEESGENRGKVEIDTNVDVPVSDILYADNIDSLENEQEENMGEKEYKNYYFDDMVIHVEVEGNYMSTSAAKFIDATSIKGCVTDLNNIRAIDTGGLVSIDLDSVEPGTAEYKILENVRGLISGDESVSTAGILLDRLSIASSDGAELEYLRIGKDNLESEVPNVVFVQISKEEDSERVLVNMLCGLSEDYKIKSVTIL